MFYLQSYSRYRSAACIALSAGFAVMLMTLCLWGLVPPVARAATQTSSMAHPFAQPEIAFISLSKTVGTDPNECASTNEIRVIPGTPVYECFTLVNTGVVTVIVNTFADTRIGEAAFVLPLGIGQSVVLTNLNPLLGQFVFTPTASIVTTATLYASSETRTISDTATTRVTTIGTQSPNMAFAHTVGTEPDVCGTTDSLNVAPGASVYSCFTAVNTASEPITMTLLELPDHYYYDVTMPPPSSLLILPPFIYPLGAGESGVVGIYPFTATATTNTTGTVFYDTGAGSTISTTAVASVNVVEEPITLRTHLPLLFAPEYEFQFPTFSATVNVVPSKSELAVGETLDVQVAIDVSEGCQYPLFELDLLLDEAEQPLFTFVLPTTSTVSAPFSNPFTYTLRAEQAGIVDFEAAVFGERFCGDALTFHSASGTSGAVTVEEN